MMKNELMALLCFMLMVVIVIVTLTYIAISGFAHP